MEEEGAKRIQSSLRVMSKKLAGTGIRVTSLLHSILICFVSEMMHRSPSLFLTHTHTSSSHFLPYSLLYASITSGPTGPLQMDMSKNGTHKLIFIDSKASILPDTQINQHAAKYDYLK